MGRLFAVAENYPQLKSDETFKQLQARITALEESIADRRELYNDQVNLNNIRVECLPGRADRASSSASCRRTCSNSRREEKRDVDVGALFRA